MWRGVRRRPYLCVRAQVEEPDLTPSARLDVARGDRFDVIGHARRPERLWPRVIEGLRLCDLDDNNQRTRGQRDLVELVHLVAAFPADVFPDRDRACSRLEHVHPIDSQRSGIMLARVRRLHKRQTTTQKLRARRQLSDRICCSLSAMHSSL